MEAFLKNFDLVPLDLAMIAVGALLFFAFYKLFAGIFVEPMLAVIRAREAATSGAEASAAENRQRAAALNAQYEEQLSNARIAAMQRRFELVGKAKQEAARIIEEAEIRAQQFLSAARSQHKQNEQELRSRFGEQIGTLSATISAKVRDALTMLSVIIFALLIEEHSGLVGVAFAEAHGEGAAHDLAHHALPSFGEFLGHIANFWINFLLFSFVAFLLLRKTLPQAMVARREAIESQVRAARAVFEQSRLELSEAERRVANVKADIARTEQDIAREGELEARMIVAEAQKRAERAEQNACDLAGAEQRAFEKKLERELVREALVTAQAQLTQDCTPDFDRRLRDNAADRADTLVQ